MNTQKRRSRILSGILTLSLVIGLFAATPLTAFAEDTPPSVSAVNANAADPVVGTALTGTYTYNTGAGTGAGAESGTTFKWYRSEEDTWGGASPEAITGATTVNYTPTGADVGKYLYFEVTPSNGSTPGTAVQSAASGQAGIMVTLSVVTNGTTGTATINGGTAAVKYVSSFPPTFAATLGTAYSVQWAVSPGGGTVDPPTGTNPDYYFPPMSSITEPIVVTATFSATPTPAIAVTYTGFTGLKVGREASGSVVYTLTNGIYAASIIGSAFWPSGFPNNMNIERVTRTSDTVVTVEVSGTPVAYNANTTSISLPYNIYRTNVQGASADIIPTGTVIASAVAKGEGLAATDPGAINILVSDTAQHTFNLDAVVLNKSGVGTRSYTIDTPYNDGYAVLFGAPSLSGTNNATLLYTGNGQTSGTATQTVTIHTNNYEDTTVIITFTAVDKYPVTKVTITNSASAYIYKAADAVHGLQHSVKIEPANATVKDVSWTSSDKAIAIVNKAGLVTFTGKEGTVRITAASADGPSHFKDIKVVRNVTKIRTPLTTVNITKGKTLTLPVELDDGNISVTKAAGTTFKSSNTKVATVDKSGKIKGVKKGTAKITVTSANGKSLTVKVNVGAKAVKLKTFTLTDVKNNALTLGAGKTSDLKIKLTESKASDLKVTFGSSKSSVAKVDAAGRITALKKGTANITVKAGGQTVKVKVTVK